MASRTSILETLPKIVANPPKIQPKSLTSRLGHMMFRVRSALSGHPWVVAGLSLGFVIGVLLYARRRRQMRQYGNTGAFFQLHEKEGLLGVSNSDGKND